MKIVVLGGGDSPEREVSLRSSASVAKAAREAGYEVTRHDPAEGLEVLDGLEDIIVFPILHGVNGEDGVIQKELEQRNLKYLGSDSKSSVNCFDKWLTHQQLEKAGITIPRGELVDKQSYGNHPLAQRPHVLKILHGGSSIGTLVVRDPRKVNPADIDEIFSMEARAVLEELIEGVEATVPILGTQALPVIEIKPPVNAEFDYQNKYNGATAELCPPENISADLQKNAQSIAQKVHKVMGCRHLSRVDLMIDKLGRIYVLEINTMPGMTDQSLYPKSALVAGISMPQLIHKFVELIEQDSKN